MSLRSAPNACSSTSPSSGEVHARRSVLCSLNSLAVSARSSPGTASGSCSSRPRTTRGARHERGRQSPPQSSPRSRASDETREREEEEEEEEEEEVAKEETVASSQSPLCVRIPSVWSRDLELYLEDPFLGSGAFATILQTTHRSSGLGSHSVCMNRLTSQGRFGTAHNTTGQGTSCYCRHGVLDILMVPPSCFCVCQTASS